MTDEPDTSPTQPGDGTAHPGDGTAQPSSTAELPGSDRQPLSGAGTTGTTGTTDATGSRLGAVPVEVTLVLRRRADLPRALVAGPDTVPASGFADRFGADPDDVATVRRVLTESGADVVDVHPASRRVRVRGTGLAELFGTELATTAAPDPVTGMPRDYRTRTGPLRLPAELAGVVTAVLGLDDRPQAGPRLRIVPAAATTTSYTPVELGRIYDFPADTDGTGQVIAIVELGGGFDTADLDTYFSGLGLATPDVSAVGVDGASNVPGGDPQGADGEVLLDVEVAGALAPGARQVVYFAPNTDAGFLDAVATAAHATPTPAALSISWGQSEDEWTAQARNAMDEAFADAAALGVTVTVAAGDDGSADRADDGGVHVDFPAASPHVLACGGTSLSAPDAAETVWNNGTGQGGTGGGVSDSFGLPDFQRDVGVPERAGGGTGAGGNGSGTGGAGGTGSTGRGVPDVAGVADPRTGYRVRVDGTDLVIGGTSAVSPLWAALVARLVQATGRPLGLLAPTIYAGVTAGAPADGFRDVTKGTNGAYRAGPGWDACTGLGTPDGTDLLARLTGSAG